jgi:predicted enzyme related to lactoylglutathione lyase
VALTEVFAGIPVADYGPAVVAWYERLVGRPPDMFPNDNEAVWRLADSGWIYVVGDSDRAGKGLLTILVDDLQEHVAGLAERGLVTEAIETVPGVVRTAVIADPDGNQIQFGEPLG